MSATATAPAEPETVLARVAGPKKKRRRVHLLVPVAKAAAPHMVSGEPPGAQPLVDGLRALGIDGRVGHQGQAYAPACDRSIVLTDIDRGTGEWWATQCEECFATDAFRELEQTVPHPKAVHNADVEEAVPARGCC